MQPPLPGRSLPAILLIGLLSARQSSRRLSLLSRLPHPRPITPPGASINAIPFCNRTLPSLCSLPLHTHWLAASAATPRPPHADPSGSSWTSAPGSTAPRVHCDTAPKTQIKACSCPPLSSLPFPRRRVNCLPSCVPPPHLPT